MFGGVSKPYLYPPAMGCDAAEANFTPTPSIFHQYRVYDLQTKVNLLERERDEAEKAAVDIQNLAAVGGVYCCFVCVNRDMMINVLIH